MQRFLAILGAGMLGVLALWLALVWLAPGGTVEPTPQASRRDAPAAGAPKLRDVTVDPTPTTVPKAAAPATAPEADAPVRPAVAPASPPVPAPAEPRQNADSALPGADVPAGDQTATVDQVEGDAAPAQPGDRFPRGSAGCTRYKTYNPETQTYRAYDGTIRPCRPL